LFEGILSAYQRHGYEAGYSRAVHDVRSALTLATAEFIRQRRIIDPAFRALLRDLESFIQQQMHASANREFVEGGLGI
jgi:hypothetical protein